MKMGTAEKLPIKLAAISIKKFNEVGIPHHLGLLVKHKTNIVRMISLDEWDKVKREEINATRVVKQLKNLLIEMDELRSKIKDEDVVKFDDQIKASREKALMEIKSYMGK